MVRPSTKMRMSPAPTTPTPYTVRNPNAMTQRHDIRLGVRMHKRVLLYNYIVVFSHALNHKDGCWRGLRLENLCPDNQHCADVAMRSCLLE